MEMEANMFLSFCNRLNIPAAVVCVSIVNRLNGDQITSSKETLRSIELYPLAMILQVKILLKSGKKVAVDNFLGNFLVNSLQFFGQFLAILCSLFGDFLVNSLQFLVNFWQFFDYFLAILCSIFANFLVVFLQIC